MKVNFPTLNNSKFINKTKKVIPRITHRTKHSKTLVPLSETPLVVYDIHNKALAKLLTMLNEANINIPLNLNVSPLSKSGLDEMSKNNIRTKIWNAYKNKQIDEETKNKLLAQVSFTSRKNAPGYLQPEQFVSPKEGQIFNPEESVPLHEANLNDVDIDNLNVALPMDLQEMLKKQGIELLDEDCEFLIEKLYYGITHGENFSEVFRDFIENI